MKGMSVSAQHKANGGFGAYCSTCGWSTSGWWLRSTAKKLARTHRSVYRGHSTYVP